MRSPTTLYQSLVLTVACLIAPVLHASGPVPVGQRALLTIAVEVTGEGERVVKSEGAHVKWSTHRVFKGKVELVSEKPEIASMVAAGSTAAEFKPSENLQALQEEAATCGDEDAACQMAAAMKMMQDPQMEKLVQQGMAQSQAQSQAAPRYQIWRVPENGGNAKIDASWEEVWDGVFMTAVREEHTCTLTAPAADKPLNQETLARGLLGLHMEVDTETGKSSLMLAFAPATEGELACRENIGGSVTQSRDTEYVAFTVPIDGETSGSWVPGTASGTAIAQGELDVTTKPEARSRSGILSVTTPLKIKVRWSVTLI